MSLSSEALEDWYAIQRLAYRLGEARVVVGGGHDIHTIVTVGGEVYHLPADREALLEAAG